MHLISLLVITTIVTAVTLTASPAAGFSPLSTFYDIDVATSASFYSGKNFGPGCARGGQIPDGFIAIAMNGLSMGMKSPAATCGMCVVIKGPAPTTADPADNSGVSGEYYGYVYEICENCNQEAGLQLGMSGKGQSPVVWRAIPCPVKQSVSIFFDGSKVDKARFQIRGLSAPIVSLTTNGDELSLDKSFFVYQNRSGNVFPLTLAVTTALGEKLAITVSAFREYGDLSDLIIVKQEVPARQTSTQAPNNTSEFGSGKIDTKSGHQKRTVATSNQAGRQVLTITNSPDGQTDTFPKTRLEVYSSTPQQGETTHNALYADSMAHGGGNLAYVNNEIDRKRIEGFLNSPKFVPRPIGANDIGNEASTNFLS